MILKKKSKKSDFFDLNRIFWFFKFWGHFSVNICCNCVHLLMFTQYCLLYLCCCALLLH